MLLLDLEKVFDTVWTDGLIYKMITKNINVNLIHVIHSYLTNRDFKVKVGDDISTIKEITAGVPQGSVLGPQLFNFYTHDFPESETVKTALYIFI